MNKLKKFPKIAFTMIFFHLNASISQICNFFMFQMQLKTFHILLKKIRLNFSTTQKVYSSNTQKISHVSMYKHKISIFRFLLAQFFLKSSCSVYRTSMNINFQHLFTSFWCIKKILWLTFVSSIFFLKRAGFYIWKDFWVHRVQNNFIIKKEEEKTFWFNFYCSEELPLSLLSCGFTFSLFIERGGMAEKKSSSLYFYDVDELILHNLQLFFSSHSSVQNMQILFNTFSSLSPFIHCTIGIWIKVFT